MFALKWNTATKATKLQMANWCK